MTGAVTNLENSIPLDKRNHAYDPVLPAVKRNRCRDEIVSKGKLMIKQTEEEAQQCFHKWSSPVDRRGSVHKKNKGLTRLVKPFGH